MRSELSVIGVANRVDGERRDRLDGALPETVEALLDRIVVAARVVDAVAHRGVGHEREDRLRRDGAGEARRRARLDPLERRGDRLAGVVDRDRRVVTHPGAEQVGADQQHRQRREGAGGQPAARAKRDQPERGEGERQPHEQRPRDHDRARAQRELRRREAPGNVEPLVDQVAPLGAPADRRSRRRAAGRAGRAKAMSQRERGPAGRSRALSSSRPQPASSAMQSR